MPVRPLAARSAALVLAAAPSCGCSPATEAAPTTAAASSAPGGSVAASRPVPVAEALALARPGAFVSTSAARRVNAVTSRTRRSSAR